MSPLRRAGLVALAGPLLALVPFLVSWEGDLSDASDRGYAAVVFLLIAAPLVLVAVAGMNLRSRLAWAIAIPVVAFDGVMFVLIATDDSSTAALGYLTTGVVGVVYGLLAVVGAALATRRVA